MRPPAADSAAVDRLHQAALRAGEDAEAARGVLGECGEESVLVALLRRAVPVRFLEQVAATPPWSDRPLVLARVVQNPRVPRGLALRLVSMLYWRDLADVSATAWVAGAVRVRAEANLRDMLPEMRLGDRITLAKLAMPPVLLPLLADADAKVVEAVLQNPRLREEDLLTAIRRETVSRHLLEAASRAGRWSERYAIRLALALQARTPLPIGLLQLSSLLKADLIRVSQTETLAPLVRAAALATVERMAGPRGSSSHSRTLKDSAR
jgi:hypothetical protein